MAKILLVDDEATSLEVLAMFLRIRGHQVSTSTSGCGALDLGRADPPDLLIADYFLLDDYDGGTVARNLREEFPMLEVLIVSGMMLDDVRDAVEDISGVHLMAKPLDLRAVENAVDELTRPAECVGPVRDPRHRRRARRKKPIAKPGRPNRRG